jgi:hypothetical protein
MQHLQAFSFISDRLKSLYILTYHWRFIGGSLAVAVVFEGAIGTRLMIEARRCYDAPTAS